MIRHFTIPLNKMKTLILLVTICVAFGSATMQAAPLSETDKQFLARYEKVRSALAADDLGAARTAAGDLGEEGAPLAKSSSLKDARAAFGKLSEKAKQLAAGQAGYYVVHCPMLQKDWVQTSEKIANPYYGKEMATCGEIKK
ncbi:MAG: hypothetical protein QOE95_2008 [Gaiellaceae bacterium]|nr:hypothetical protein [Gaiellaceae bacterium]